MAKYVHIPAWTHTTRGFYVYTLCDPCTRCVRYVGTTIDPRRRQIEHARCLSTPKDVCDWVRTLTTYPLLVVQGVFETREDAERVECELKLLHEELGSQLLNKGIARRNILPSWAPQRETREATKAFRQELHRMIKEGARMGEVYK